MVPAGPPKRGGRWKSISLALAVHLALVAMLVVGIRWKTSPPPALQAELFTPPPKPLPTPKPAPTPRPVPLTLAPEMPNPDIVIEQRRRAAEEAERQEQAKKRAEEEKRKAEELAKKKIEDLAKKKVEDEKKKLEDEKQKAEDEKRKAAELAKKEAAAKARQEAEERAQRAAQEKAERVTEAQRSAYLKELMDKAGTPGGTAASGGNIGSAGGSGAGAPGGADSSYRTRLSTLIRDKTVFAIPPDLTGNPKAVFTVTVNPDCTISAVRLRKSSGVTAWDQAAERGIQRSSPLPRMRDGTCPPDLEITRGPRDHE